MTKISFRAVISCYRKCHYSELYYFLTMTVLKQWPRNMAINKNFPALRD